MKGFPMQPLSRRAILIGGLGLGAGALTACSTTGAAGFGSATVGPAAATTPSPGQKVLLKTLVARPTTLDLGGPKVATWAYGDTVPGPLIRATAGDFLRITLDNQLPADTTIHWHGIRIHNPSDGVPGMTQDPVKPGTLFTYQFAVPDPGTYFFHPHVGVQLDRGLYAPLVIDDPREPGGYDAEWLVVLDDWVDGTGRTPDDVLKQLVAAGGSASSSSMGGMGGMGGAQPWGDAGDVTYPYFLLNGKIPAAPETFSANPGQRVRLRIINAASDTIFTVALGGHQMTVTHTDGYAVVPQEVGAFYIGMGERYDVVVTLKDGVFPLVAKPFGKTSGGQALGLIRTGSGTAPGPDVSPAELGGPVLIGSRLQPAEFAKLPAKAPDAIAQLTLEGSMQPYQWGINGAQFGKNTPLTVRAGQRLRINVMNMTMMTHPLHLHGHTFALPSGLRKDTVLLAPMEQLPIELDADNAGDWMIHCHNIYHAESGMMIGLRYVK
jgi:FtsP/CotA-like multicopper oxidase with cupredoxin domain